MSAQHKVTNSQRQQMIAEAAYFRAERRGFNGGDTVRDWCEAEAEIDAQLRKLEDRQLVEGEQDLEKLAVLRDSRKPKPRRLEAKGKH